MNFVVLPHKEIIFLANSFAGVRAFSLSAKSCALSALFHQQCSVLSKSTLLRRKIEREGIITTAMLFR